MRSDSRFVALLPVRDEGDIIRECLVHALKWADRIYVYDTGSVDDTWDIVRELARSDERVKPIARVPVYYNENRVRGLLFETAREYLRDGDWFVRIDADEFHHVRPQDFVSRRVSPREGVVYHQYFDFQLTRAEAEGLKSAAAIATDREKSIAERRRHYTVSDYSEPRLCRYRASMRWPVMVSFPYNAGLVAKRRLPIRHYPHRDPEQLERRCRLRAIMMADKENRLNWTRPEAHRWSVGDWRRFLVDDDAPELKVWEQGTELPDIRQTNHIPRGVRRAVQHVLYALSLPSALDLTRKGWSPDAYPLPIAPETQEILARELSR
ncbi:MAG: glycosyltransferase family 2 protein [Hyphomicrobiaceae bacterium]|nr:glycosyltransferase family 2 protein [Hyphomicrobiaceae bacterium]